MDDIVKPFSELPADADITKAEWSWCFFNGRKCISHVSDENVVTTYDFPLAVNQVIQAVSDDSVRSLQYTIQKALNIPFAPPPKNNPILPDGVHLKNHDEVIDALMRIVKDAKIIGKAGCTNLPSVRCDVAGLTLGHWQRLWDAMGDDAHKALDAARNSDSH